MGVSLYSKDELPTWNELYNEFYKNRVSDYDPGDPDQQTPDHYWKIPRRKVLLAMACNQLNKIIFEDKINPVNFIIKEHQLSKNTKIEYIGFALIEQPITKWIYGGMKEFVKDGTPKIYTVPIPSTNEYSIFITNNHDRISLNDIKNSFDLGAIINSSSTILLYNHDIWSLIAFLLKDVIEYFENGIGWKDENGDIVESKQVISKCDGAGFDPAL